MVWGAGAAPGKTQAAGGLAGGRLDGEVEAVARLGHGHGAAPALGEAADVVPGGVVIHHHDEFLGFPAFQGLLGADHRQRAGQAGEVEDFRHKFSFSYFLVAQASRLWPK